MARPVPRRSERRRHGKDLGRRRPGYRERSGACAGTTGPARELVDPAKQPGLAHYLYVPGVDPQRGQDGLRRQRRPGRERARSSPRSSSSRTPRAPAGSRREYRVVDGLDRLDISVDRSTRRRSGRRRASTSPFPSPSPAATARVDVGWGFVRPEADQIAGACRDFFCARDSVDISNGEFGVTWTSLDAPLVEVGAITDETPGEGERRLWLRKLEPSSLLFSYAMNNYWHTNYKADQEGPGDPALRRRTRTAAPDTATAKRLGLEAVTPLVADPGRLGVARAAIPAGRRAGPFVATVPQAVRGRPGLGPAAPQRLGPPRDAPALGRGLRRRAASSSSRPRRNGGRPVLRPRRGARLRHPDPPHPKTVIGTSAKKGDIVLLASHVSRESTAEGIIRETLSGDLAMRPGPDTRILRIESGRTALRITAADPKVIPEAPCGRTASSPPPGQGGMAIWPSRMVPI